MSLSGKDMLHLAGQKEAEEQKKRQELEEQKKKQQEQAELEASQELKDFQTLSVEEKQTIEEEIQRHIVERDNANLNGKVKNQ